jgi:hypothetical protein
MPFSLRMTCSNPSRLTVALRLSILLCFVGALRAQEPPCLRRTVVASVLTPTGQPVANVPASSFRGTFRGKPVRVLSATRDLGPRRVVVLLDASGSMPQPSNGKWQLALRVARDIVVASPDEFQVALILFADKADLVTGFAEGRKAAADGLAALEPGRGCIPKGKTALFDAILEGLKLLKPARPGDVIYAITDGGENASRSNHDQVEKSLITSRVRFFTFLVTEPLAYHARTSEEMNGPSEMQDLTEKTGGDILMAPGSPPYGRKYDLNEKERAELGRSVAQLYRQMSQFYLLELELPVPVDRPRQWKLEMVDARGGKSKEWHATYQRILLPCSAPTPQK